MHPHRHAEAATAIGAAQTTKRDYLDVRETARRAGVSASFLNKARISGDGPEFVKLGRNVRYYWPAVEAWLQSRTRRSTSQQIAA